ncbi:MAG TPA: LuxR C-terminal-related transcriptional regulator, partial [Acidimicrobiia bacterium]|nr:LuxR C-terminal-related transcriptional regulator [Acidimicrobiia bacterium]
RLADAEHAVANRPRGATTPADDVARTLTKAICDAGRGRTAHALAAVTDLQAPRSGSNILRATTSLAVDALQQRSIRRRAPLTNSFLADLCAALGAVDLLVEHPMTTAYPVERSLARARRLFTTGRDDDAILDALVPLTDVACHPRSQVELYTLCALAADRTGRDQSALGSLRRALARAFADDMRAPFMGYGRAAAALLERYAWQLGEHHSYAVAVLEDVRQSDPPVFVETLTDRELAVLEYLPTMMSNVEIARQLYVSVNTVKTHLKSVYRKLGVERRRDAVVRARQLELL